MTARRGDVVLVDWPFSDQTGKKLRPASSCVSNATTQSPCSLRKPHSAIGFVASALRPP
jgi:hypothetical protein